MYNTNHKRGGYLLTNTLIHSYNINQQNALFLKLIFEFLSSDVSNPRVRLKEDGCIYRHGIDHTCIYNRQKLKYYFRKGAFCWFILYNYITMHGAKKKHKTH
jgi:hypothetical protein